MLPCVLDAAAPPVMLLMMSIKPASIAGIVSAETVNCNVIEVWPSSKNATPEEGEILRSPTGNDQDTIWLPIVPWNLVIFTVNMSPWFTAIWLL